MLVSWNQIFGLNRKSNVDSDLVFERDTKVKLTLLALIIVDGLWESLLEDIIDYPLDGFKKIIEVESGLDKVKMLFKLKLCQKQYVIYIINLHYIHQMNFVTELRLQKSMGCKLQWIVVYQYKRFHTRLSQERRHKTKFQYKYQYNNCAVSDTCSLVKILNIIRQLKQQLFVFHFYTRQIQKFFIQRNYERAIGRFCFQKQVYNNGLYNY
ncbi:Hypothetical_protein [Hexamita inflata]|uniref:Hypothetical_protein n=1 Tax=Hexamita inflata TaxID=28002 RepID=A0AA86V243_9EUKA|nr:Hypothetical protein HINF_LOCUS60976 [Hexamita inflata]